MTVAVLEDKVGGTPAICRVLITRSLRKAIVVHFFYHYFSERLKSNFIKVMSKMYGFFFLNSMIFLLFVFVNK